MSEVPFAAVIRISHGPRIQRNRQVLETNLGVSLWVWVLTWLCVNGQVGRLASGSPPWEIPLAPRDTQGGSSGGPGGALRGIPGGIPQGDPGWTSVAYPRG